MRFDIDLSSHVGQLEFMFKRLDGDLLGNIVEDGLTSGARQAAREVRKTTRWKDRRPGSGLRSKIRGSRGKRSYTPSAIVHVGGKGARQGNILQYGSVNSTKAKGFVEERIAIGKGQIDKVFEERLERSFRRVLQELDGKARVRARSMRALNRSNFLFGNFSN